MEPSLGINKVLKVVRCSLYLSGFTYHIEHITGDANIWRDIMARWMRGYRKPPAIRRITCVIPFSGVIASPNSPEFELPSMAEIRKAQETHRSEAANTTRKEDYNVMRIDNAVWILNDFISLKWRLLAIANAGSAGHRGVAPIWHSLRKTFVGTDQK